MMDVEGKISVIMPAFNEAGAIRKNVYETINTFKNFGKEFEVIIINDGSTDNTWQEIKELADKFPEVKVARNMQNYGKGRALKKGFRLVSGDYIVFLDSDIDLHPAQIETFFDIMKLDNVDVVIGSKRHPNSVLNYPPGRKFMSNVYYFLIKIMFGLPIRDTQTGLKLYKYEVLKKIF
ncbi:MAG: glycosyltransferase family 2 protein, partial [Candidatus Omnitrophica bacterium]|nr:glycosyltransferase family 2 protein [Candidatus Omnitrophota bacterium]